MFYQYILQRWERALDSWVRMKNHHLLGKWVWKDNCFEGFLSSSIKWRVIPVLTFMGYWDNVCESIIINFDIQTFNSSENSKIIWNSYRHTIWEMPKLNSVLSNLKASIWVVTVSDCLRYSEKADTVPALRDFTVWHHRNVLQS